MRPIMAMALTSLLLAGLAGAASADVTIEMRQDGKPMTTYVAPHKISSFFDGGGMIFRGEEKVLWALDSETMKAAQITEADAKVMSARLSQARKAMSEIPPEMRAQVQGMMGKMRGVEPVRKVKPLAEKRTINGFETWGYTVAFESSGNVTEVWTTDPKNIGLEGDDFSAFKELADFMQAMVPGLESVRDLIKNYADPDPDDVPGFPVLSIEKDPAGKVLSKTELVEVQHAEVAAARFDLPAGYTKEKIESEE